MKLFRRAFLALMLVSSFLFVQCSSCKEDEKVDPKTLIEQLAKGWKLVSATKDGVDLGSVAGKELVLKQANKLASDYSFTGFTPPIVAPSGTKVSGTWALGSSNSTIIFNVGDPVNERTLSLITATEVSIVVEWTEPDAQKPDIKYKYRYAFEPK